MYTNDFNTLKSLLIKGELPQSSVFDVSPETDLEQLGDILLQYGHPLNFTIDFKFASIPPLTMQALMNGFASEKSSSGLTLAFSSANLSQEALTCLFEHFTTGTLKPGITLRMPASNLARHGVFSLLVDKITDPQCAPWLTVDFWEETPDAARINEEEIDYLLSSLEKTQMARGRAICVGQYVTTPQQHLLHKKLEQLARRDFLHLEKAAADYTPEVHTILLNMTKEAFGAEARENKKWVCQEIQTHIEELRKATFSKVKRIEALQRLTTQLNQEEKKFNPISELIDAWEKQTTTVDKKTHTEATLISASYGTLSMFRNTTVPTSTECLITRLKTEFQVATAPEPVAPGLGEPTAPDIGELFDIELY